MSKLYHAAELAGLGTLAAPSLKHMVTGKDMSKKNQHRAEIAGLGILAAPSIYHLAKGFMKRASDHYHIDSTGEKTSPSDHKGKGEEAPHDHKLKRGGSTDMRPSGIQHKHEEPNGKMTGDAIKTGFMKAAVNSFYGGNTMDLGQGSLHGGFNNKNTKKKSVPPEAKLLGAVGLASLGFNEARKADQRATKIQSLVSKAKKKHKEFNAFQPSKLQRGKKGISLVPTESGPGFKIRSNPSIAKRFSELFGNEMENFNKARIARKDRNIFLRQAKAVRDSSFLAKGLKGLKKFI